MLVCSNSTDCKICVSIPREHKKKLFAHATYRKKSVSMVVREFIYHLPNPPKEYFANRNFPETPPEIIRYSQDDRITSYEIEDQRLREKIKEIQNLTNDSKTYIETRNITKMDGIIIKILEILLFGYYHKMWGSSDSVVFQMIYDVFKYKIQTFVKVNVDVKLPDIRRMSNLCDKII